MRPGCKYNNTCIRDDPTGIYRSGRKGPVFHNASATDVVSSSKRARAGRRRSEIKQNVQTWIFTSGKRRDNVGEGRNRDLGR